MRPFLLCLVIVACRSEHTAARPTAQVDTLATGTVVVTSPAPVGWRDSTGSWKIVEEQRYGTSGDSASELIEPTSLAVDEADRLYVADTKPSAIKVYNSDGSFVRRVGRAGSGPGEFRTAYIAARFGKLVVHDPAQMTTSVFDTAGTFVKSWHSFCCYFAPITIDTAGRVIMAVWIPQPKEAPASTQFARFRLDGSVIDTLFLPTGTAPKTWLFGVAGPNGRRNIRMTMPIPYTSRSVFALHPFGGLVHGATGAPRIVWSTNGRDSARVMVRSWTAEPISDAIRSMGIAAAVEMAKGSVGEVEARATAKLDEVPTTAPAFSSLRVDEEGLVWASRISPNDTTKTTFDVYDAAGQWLGPVVVPVRVQDYGVSFFARGKLYVTIEDDEGRPVVIRFGVRR